MPGARPSATVRPAVVVEGVRTPFGRARPERLHARTRADDPAVETAIAVGHPLASSGAHR